MKLPHVLANEASCRVAEKAGFAAGGDHARLVPAARRVQSTSTCTPGWRVGMTAIEHVEIAAGRLQLRPPSPSEAADALAMLLDPDVAAVEPGPTGPGSTSTRRAAWCRRGADWSDGSHATFSVLDADDRAAARQRVAAQDRPRAAGRRDRLPRRAVGTRPGRRDRRARRGDPVGVRRPRPGAHRGLPRTWPTSRPAGSPRRRAIRCEGTLRQSYVYGDGQRYDEHLHARLASDPAAA